MNNRQHILEPVAEFAVEEALLFTRFLQRRVITRHRQDALYPAVFSENGGHRHRPEFWCTEKSVGRCFKVEGLAGSGGFQRLLPNAGSIIFQKRGPEAALHRIEVADLHNLHATLTHEGEVAFKVEYLDAVGRCSKHTAHEALAVTQFLLGSATLDRSANTSCRIGSERDVLRGPLARHVIVNEEDGYRAPVLDDGQVDHCSNRYAFEDLRSRPRSWIKPDIGNDNRTACAQIRRMVAVVIEAICTLEAWIPLRCPVFRHGKGFAIDGDRTVPDAANAECLADDRRRLLDRPTHVGCISQGVFQLDQRFASLLGTYALGDFKEDHRETIIAGRLANTIVPAMKVADLSREAHCFTRIDDAGEFQHPFVLDTGEELADGPSNDRTALDPNQIVPSVVHLFIPPIDDMSLCITYDLTEDKAFLQRLEEAPPFRFISPEFCRGAIPLRFDRAPIINVDKDTGECLRRTILRQFDAPVGLYPAVVPIGMTNTILVGIGPPAGNGGVDGLR